MLGGIVSRPSKMEVSKRTLTVCCAVLVFLLCLQSTYQIAWRGKIVEAVPAVDLVSEIESLQHSAPEPPHEPSEDELDDDYIKELKRLGKMVRKTNGYFVRDWSLGLGWNNMRYILEAAFFQSQLLNRTLVIPSFVYARSCEFSPDVCAAYTTMVDKGQALNTDEWRDATPLEQIGFRIPIELMIDLPHLQSNHPVVTIPQFLDLENIPTDEASNGAWDREGYLRDDQSEDEDLFVIRNDEYDPSGVIRVDRLPDPSAPRPAWEQGEAVDPNDESDAYIWFDEGQSVRPLSQVMQIVEEEVQKGLDLAVAPPKLTGVQPLYTFTGPGGMEFTKSVVYPEVDIALKSSLRGFVDDYGNVPQRIILLEGETHLGRKPGQMWFTTAAARDAFASAVLYTVQPPAPLRELALDIAERMNQRCEGRLWRSAHMRRGDFVKVGWVQGNSIQEHFQRVVRNLREGEMVLREIKKAGKGDRFEVPLSSYDGDIIRLESPQHDDPIYISTDEKNPSDIEWLQNNGAVILSDLITSEDHQTVGWSLLVTDVLGVLEQLVMGHSDIFYGHVMSSLAGGVVNYRAKQGKQPRLTLLD